MTLFYAESRDFVFALDRRFGRDRLRVFVAEYVRDPARWQATFARVFGVSFDAALATFTAAAR